MKRLLPVLLLAIPMCGQFTVNCVTASAATGISSCASEATSFLQQAQLVATYARQALQLKEAVDQTQDMLKNSAKISTIYGNISSELVALGRVAQLGQSIAIGGSNLDAQYRAVYSGYGAYSPVNYAQKYANMAQTTLDSMQGALRMAGLSAAQQGGVQGIISALRSALSSTDSRNGMISALAQIADAQNENAIRMHSVMTEDLVSKQVFRAHVVQKEAMEVAAAEHYFGKSTSAPDTTAFRPGK